MGMYNEVRARCPHCNAVAEIQIQQIVDGFGEFCLGIPSTLEDLSYDEKVALASLVNHRKFTCTGSDPHTFSVQVDVRLPGTDRDRPRFEI